MGEGMAYIMNILCNIKGVGMSRLRVHGLTSSGCEGLDLLNSGM